MTWWSMVAEAIPLAADNYGACLDPLSCRIAVPRLARPLQPCADDPFAATLDCAAADSIASGARFRMARAVAMVLEVVDRLLRGVVIPVQCDVNAESSESDLKVYVLSLVHANCAPSLALSSPWPEAAWKASRMYSEA